MYGGYCFLNNAAIAAQWFRDHGARRVAVLDIDFHHGNGTQDIFYERENVLYLSLYGDPREAFPHFSGYLEETWTRCWSRHHLQPPHASRNEVRSVVQHTQGSAGKA